MGIADFPLGASIGVQPSAFNRTSAPDWRFICVHPRLSAANMLCRDLANAHPAATKAVPPHPESDV
jgi:hypothetical protein